MNAPAPQPLVFHANRPGQDVAARLAKVVSGAVMADAASCARYATDASIYQVQPVAILVPASDDDVRAAIEVCRHSGCRSLRVAPAARSAARPSVRRWSSITAST